MMLATGRMQRSKDLSMKEVRHEMKSINISQITVSCKNRKCAHKGTSRRFRIFASWPLETSETVKPFDL